MSHQIGRVVSEILNRHFGEIVQKVGNDLFTFGAKPIAMIVKSTGLSRMKVIESLRTLLKFDLVTFEPSKNEVIADYKLLHDNVLLLIRYPRYLLQIKSKYGSEAELITEEILQQGCCTSTRLLVSIAKKYKDDKERNLHLVTLKDTFISLATAGYIQQAPVAEIKEGCEVPTLVPVATIVPNIDVRTLVLAMTDEKAVEDNIYWKINYDRFHQDFRDDIMIKAVTLRIDENAGELMRHLLMQMSLRSAPWAAASTPIPVLELRDACRRQSKEYPLLGQFFDHYLKVLEESGGGMVGATDGHVHVRQRAAAATVLRALLERLLVERRGSHAARIFRLIDAKKYIEEDDIQKHAMLPNKQCKELTYKLLEEHFISVQPMRKTAAAGGMMKAIYLYHINLHEVAHVAQQMCARALAACLSRAASARAAHSRLLQKQRRVRSIVHGMRLSAAPQHQIDDVEDTITPPERALLQTVEKTLKQLAVAEIELDKSLFIISWYFMYNTK